jgi:hypothetical protein
MGHCPYCKRAKQELANLGLTFKEIDVDKAEEAGMRFWPHTDAFLFERQTPAQHDLKPRAS